MPSRMNEPEHEPTSFSRELTPTLWVTAALVALIELCAEFVRLLSGTAVARDGRGRN